MIFKVYKYQLYNENSFLNSKLIQMNSISYIRTYLCTYLMTPKPRNWVLPALYSDL
jgi:hypothetical protein